MPDDITIPVAAVTGSGGLLAFLAGWFRHNSRIGEIEGKIETLETKLDDGDKNAALAAAAVAQNLATFQLEAEKRFAKDESVQATLARLHSRIDEMVTKEEFKEARDDIKKLLVKAGVA